MGSEPPSHGPATAGPGLRWRSTYGIVPRIGRGTNPRPKRNWTSSSQSTTLAKQAIGADRRRKPSRLENQPSHLTTDRSPRWQGVFMIP
jgi:hypothetical protein